MQQTLTGQLSAAESPKPPTPAAGAREGGGSTCSWPIHLPDRAVGPGAHRGEMLIPLRHLPHRLVQLLPVKSATAAHFVEPAHTQLWLPGRKEAGVGGRRRGLGGWGRREESGGGRRDVTWGDTQGSSSQPNLLT